MRRKFMNSGRKREADEDEVKSGKDKGWECAYGESEKEN